MPIAFSHCPRVRRSELLLFAPSRSLLFPTEFAKANFCCSLPLAVSYSRPSSLKRTFQNLLFQSQNHIEFAKANFLMFCPNLLLLNMTEFAKANFLLTAKFGWIIIREAMGIMIQTFQSLACHFWLIYSIFL